MVEGSGHISECTNVINMFHGVNIILYMVTSIGTPRPGFYQNAINMFCSESLALFTLTSIHNI